MKQTDWQKIFRWQQKSDWCGPAVIQMVLAAGGIRATQAKIAKDVFLPWWGVTQQAIYAYLSKYFKSLNFKSNGTIADLTKRLKEGKVIIVNWWDDLEGLDDEDGHYTLLLDVDKKNKKVVLADPSEGRGIWKMDIKKFRNHWYDSLDLHRKKWVEGWMLWVDPESKI
ncbi:hypothetical protein A3D84_02000 [Candidatus Woesebacteria bacterium RIFCSPHIGHO2_02_FULL_42_20]|uniref:Peptidase C39 domain-containing protein n=1 Tax=Candidatus Woesebacteria bacterium RIFCSPHIGHO2_12_FULL_41_24 TaxID=1802510 RepID=A0A1F8AUB8_9BACT|nr:MAG: hypothetical protein A2W15_04285 [Candidatus Woesebacteria bacterium RBG_16_41_13]OGM30021.1 MAG: hypothetical protein A2873_04835 [Candidatus Woesebacteria bacterium RIFCSPHIGHO2_01_FULL_42_80]OGM35099.1 MAG: hypothetical protein A3D84_02000 [Candidatus Woesebacteria bacterium RIFCSPHIGHO2_02_FULL_42_20]OGM54835.1 MAG: hypothetical protein A3E44_01600 [Candidatus Woesebacteria bacterium RIFCSPHIGHO2_12_FULL_41_24]OGM67451.1 MAG: hypothetical protein A2969_05450 [Candidatus Woesebacteri